MTESKNLTFVGSKDMSQIDNVITQSQQDKTSHTSGTPDTTSLCFVQGASADDSSAVVFRGKVVKGLSKDMEDLLIDQLFEKEKDKYSITLSFNPASINYNPSASSATIGKYTITNNAPDGTTEPTVSFTTWPQDLGTKPTAQLGTNDVTIPADYIKGKKGNASVTVTATYTYAGRQFTKTGSATLTHNFYVYYWAQQGAPTTAPTSPKSITTTCSTDKSTNTTEVTLSGKKIDKLTLNSNDRICIAIPFEHASQDGKKVYPAMNGSTFDNQTASQITINNVPCYVWYTNTQGAGTVSYDLSWVKSNVNA